MLRSNRYADIFATLLLSCLGFVGWTQLDEEHSFQSETMVAVESRSPNLVGERLCSYDDRQIDLNNAKISIFGNCSGFYSELAKPIAMKSLDRKVEDVFTLKASRDRQREMLKANLNNFTPSDRVISLDWRMPPKIAPRE